MKVTTNKIIIIQSNGTFLVSSPTDFLLSIYCTNPLLNIFEDQLHDINKAKRIHQTYLSGINESMFNLMYFDNEMYEKFLDIQIEYMLKLRKLALEKELDIDNAFVYLDASLPLKAIFEFKKDKFSKIKKKS